MAEAQRSTLPDASADRSPPLGDSQSRIAVVETTPAPASDPSGRLALLHKLTAVGVRSLVSIGILGGGVAAFVYLQATRPAPIPEEVGSSRQAPSSACA